MPASHPLHRRSATPLILRQPLAQKNQHLLTLARNEKNARLAHEESRRSRVIGDSHRFRPPSLSRTRPSVCSCMGRSDPNVCMFSRRLQRTILSTDKASDHAHVPRTTGSQLPDRADVPYPPLQGLALPFPRVDVRETLVVLCSRMTAVLDPRTISVVPFCPR